MQTLFYQTTLCVQKIERCSINSSGKKGAKTNKLAPFPKEQRISEKSQDSEEMDKREREGVFSKYGTIRKRK